MKKILLILLVLACVPAGHGETMLVMVDGYCYLECQSDYSGTKVKFIKVSPSAVTDSTYTDASGYFSIADLHEGIYDVEYSHSGYGTVLVEDQVLVGNTTLPPVTLDLVSLSGALNCTLGPGTYHIIDTIWVNSGDSLILVPPTTFIFDGTYPFNIYGTLFGEGTESDSIVFTTYQSWPNSWQGLRFSGAGSSESRLSYCLIEKGFATGTWPNGYGGGLFLYECSPTFAHCTISQSSADSSGGALYCKQSSATFEYCTLIGNAAFCGGGVACSGSSAHFANCIISSNGGGAGAWALGGGIYCSSYDSCSFANCTVRRNSVHSDDAYAGGSGGGVHCSDSSPSFTDCTIDSNGATYGRGGGVSCSNSSPVFTNCTVNSNSATYGSGGGVSSYDNSLPTFLVCAFSGNSANSAAGVRCSNSSAIFTNCTFSANSATGGNPVGGGVGFYSSSPILVNCTLSGNSAGYGGGGAYFSSSSPHFTNCTFSGNSTGTYGRGGEVYCYSSSPTINSTIIAFSTQGGGVYFQNSAGSNIGYCDIYGNIGGDIRFYNNDPFQGPPGIGVLDTINANCDSADIYLNIFLDPMFADVVTGDFHLTDASHCIGAGDPTNPPPTDFEGDPRPNPPGSYPDIGIDESPKANPYPSNLSGSLCGTLGPGVYHVVGTISINSGNTLRLLPPTTFIFDGPYPFNINGTLLAEGTESDSIIFTTYQSGSNRWRGLRFGSLGSSGSLLTYCRIEKGYATGSWPNNAGGGVYCSNSSPNFTNCTLSGNSAPNGGGLFCKDSSPIFSYCTFRQNWANDGGGMFCRDSRPVFTHCIISGNRGDWGGGTYSQAVDSSVTSAASFMSCAFESNDANDGGGVYCNHSSPEFTNCVFSDNSAWRGGGMECMYTSSPSFMFCTFSGNRATYFGGGAYCYDSSPNFNSTIIAFSSNDGGIYFRNSAGSQVLSCDIYGNSGGDIAFYNNDPSNGPLIIGLLVTTNANCDSADTYYNVFLDPMFADAGVRDFHLTDCSHCIGAGDPADTVTTDFEGDPRPNPSGTFPDIGIDESPLGFPQELPVTDLVIRVAGWTPVNFDAVLYWSSIGVGAYHVYGAMEPFMPGACLASVMDTTWTDVQAESRPERYFYYVTASCEGSPGSAARRR